MKESMMLKDVYTVSERAPGHDSPSANAKDRWTLIGIGFVNRDDSINVVLDAVPINGRLHIRNRRVNPPRTGKAGYVGSSRGANPDSPPRHPPSG